MPCFFAQSKANIIPHGRMAHNVRDPKAGRRSTLYTTDSRRHATKLAGHRTLHLSIPVNIDNSCTRIGNEWPLAGRQRISPVVLSISGEGQVGNRRAAEEIALLHLNLGSSISASGLPPAVPRLAENSSSLRLTTRLALSVSSVSGFARFTSDTKLPPRITPSMA
jgi:hypothetical protein